MVIKRGADFIKFHISLKININEVVLYFRLTFITYLKKHGLEHQNYNIQNRTVEGISFFSCKQQTLA